MVDPKMAGVHEVNHRLRRSADKHQYGGWDLQDVPQPVNFRIMDRVRLEKVMLHEGDTALC